VAQALPALMRAIKLQAKAARVGFDWPSADNVLDKIVEEAKELQHAAPEKRAEEFGDLLFAVVNLGRHYGVDAEEALRGANRKFERRFAFIESELNRLGKTPAQSDLAEMDSLWDKAKSKEI
jgi:ATP diphosphatase